MIPILFSNSQLVTSSWDRLAILADAETGEEVSKLSGHDQEINDIHAHMTQRLVLTASKDTTFRLWDFRGSQMMVHVSQGHNQQVRKYMVHFLVCVGLSQENPSL